MLNSPKIRKVFSALLSCIILFSSSITATAASGEVAFDGNKFSFKPENKDIFVNFKDLMPGDKAEQHIKLINNSDKKTNFSMRMKVADQETISAEELELIEELLFNQELLKITITANEKVIYSDSAGGSERKKLTDVGAYTSALLELGSLSPGGYYTELNVILEASKDLDNRYQKAIANIDWEFIAEQFDDTGDTTSNNVSTGVTGGGSGLPEMPSTGYSDFYGVILIAVATASVAVCIVASRRKTEKIR